MAADSNVMKFRFKQTLKSPLWLTLFFSFGMMATGFLAVHAAAWFDHRFPQPYQNMSFFGYFDPLGFFDIFLLSVGAFLGAIWCLWFLTAAIMYLFRRRHPK
jgi:hypothetical protein